MQKYINRQSYLTIVCVATTIWQKQCIRYADLSNDTIIWTFDELLSKYREQQGDLEIANYNMP